MRRISVIGTGYVGLVTGTCFADLGNEVSCVDIDEGKVSRLRQGHLPIYEPGLEELVVRNMKAGRLSFTTSYPEGIEGADFIFIAVDTPSGVEGEADLTSVRRATEDVARCLKKEMVIVSKSTVPIGAGELIASIIQRVNPHVPFSVVANPEFLREGQAVQDFMQPDRVVLGASDRTAAQKVATLYSAFKCPMIITDLRTAEMVKYASNAFLATRLSFINEIAAICDKLGADVKEVARGMGLDKRIGSLYLEAGLGYGGSCLPKDVKALEYMAAIHGCHPQLLRAVMEINRDQRRGMVQHLRSALGGLEGRTIGVLGLSFKPETDDMRGAPSLEVIHLLESEGARVKAYDPAAMEIARSLLPRVELCPDPYKVAEGSDALAIVTEWNEFKQLNMERIKGLLKQPVIADGRNIYDGEEMRRLGFVYYGIGRGNLRGTPNSQHEGERLAV